MTNSPTRFEPDVGFVTGAPGMYVNTAGSYIKFEDYEQLKQRLDAVVAECAVLKVAVDGFNQELYGKGFKVLGWHLNGATEPLDSWFEENDWTPETPATDAALAEVEAKAIEKFAEHLHDQAPHVEECDMESYEVFGHLATEFAKELREGRV